MQTCCAFSIPDTGRKGTAAAVLEKGDKPLKQADRGAAQGKKQILLLLCQIETWDIAGIACHQGNVTTATTTMLHRKGKENHFLPLISIATFHGSTTKSLFEREAKPETKPRLETAPY